MVVNEMKFEWCTKLQERGMRVSSDGIAVI